MLLIVAEVLSWACQVDISQWRRRCHVCFLTKAPLKSIYFLMKSCLLLRLLDSLLVSFRPTQPFGCDAPHRATDFGEIKVAKLKILKWKSSELSAYDRRCAELFSGSGFSRESYALTGIAWRNRSSRRVYSVDPALSLQDCSKVKIASIAW